jgi:hypothetical protein
MNVSQRRWQRGLWLLVLPLVAAVLAAAARLPTEVPANPQWPAAVPAEQT